MPSSPVVLRSEPGIKRDGTRFEGDNYVDGQWVRFQRGLPRKIGGYRQVNRYLTEVSRGFNAYTQGDLQYCHSGSESLLERFTIDTTYSSSIITDRTPAALTPDANNVWTFANSYDASTTNNQLLAHVAPNGQFINNAVGGEIYAGDLTGTGVLTPVALPGGVNATGGIVMLHPYLFYYGSDGIVGWSVAGTPTDLVAAGAGQARVWGQKIIKGLPLRAGSGTAPAGIFWAFDAVIRSSFTGGTTVFAFDVLATDTSILSANSVVDYDGVFYWPGVDRFLSFNGVVREVPNTLNINYFYDGMNWAQSAKVFAFKVPRYGEIWWCYPRGSATECTNAIIYNVRENTWYDTLLPTTLRVAGQYNNFFARPLLLDGVASSDGYRVWLHEIGTDAIDGSDLAAIEAYYETADLSTLTQGVNQGLHIEAVEPDFVQSGEMSVEIRGRANARAPEVNSDPVAFPATASTPAEQLVRFREQRREMRVRFTSNAPGGDFQQGQVIAHIAPADRRVLG